MFLQRGKGHNRNEHGENHDNKGKYHSSFFSVCNLNETRNKNWLVQSFAASADLFLILTAWTDWNTFFLFATCVHFFSCAKYLKQKRCKRKNQFRIKGDRSKYLLFNFLKCNTQHHLQASGGESKSDVFFQLG